MPGTQQSPDGGDDRSPRIALVRWIAWLSMLAIAAAQAWTARFYATPDGVSYLDLSDAVLTGRLGELLNPYWSPLYPFLIGVLRLAVPGAYWEFAIVHLLNFVLFILSLLAFEYFLKALRTLSQRAGKRWMETAWGTAGAYAVFGVLMLMMTPLSLPTPDLLVTAACFVVFGALIRLQRDAEPRRAAIVLGVALAIGSLAKSFIIPWAAICLVVAVIAVRPRWRTILPAVVIWAIAVVPWSVALSMRMGRPTFGDTGRLTYVWYVNQRESPSLKAMPHAAATPVTNAILSGVAVLPNATGSNPVWYDPARWYTDLAPRFEAGKQIKVFSYLVSLYIASLGPIVLVLWFWLAVAGRKERARWWQETWVVIVPSLAAVGAYSMILVTLRYVAPFYVAITLLVLAAARWPTQLSATNVLIGIGAPLLIMATTPGAAQGVAVINAVASVVLFVWFVRDRSRGVQIAMGLVGATVVRVLQGDFSWTYLTITAVALFLAYWLAARRALANDRGGQFSTIVRGSMLASNAALIVIVAAVKIVEGIRIPHLNAAERNDSWYTAGHAMRAGIRAGDRIAIVGSPFDAYWVRALRAQIVAVVPPLAMDEFNSLTPDQRRQLYAEFVKAGANRIVIQQREPPDRSASAWVAADHIGWVRALP